MPKTVIEFKPSLHRNRLLLGREVHILTGEIRQWISVRPAACINLDSSDGIVMRVIDHRQFWKGCDIYLKGYAGFWAGYVAGIRQVQGKRFFVRGISISGGVLELQDRSHRAFKLLPRQSGLLDFRLSNLPRGDSSLSPL